MADDGPAQVVAGARLEPALSGERIRAGLDVEVLGVARGRRTASGGRPPWPDLVGAEEVAHVDQHAEVRVVDGVDQLLDAVAVLAEEAVVLDHGPDALRPRHTR